MMRALYTAATGMMAQQLNMDVISNNLANVNTTGFKRSRADFQSLLYQQIRPAGTVVAQGAQRPVGIEVGLGVQPGTTETMFDEGTLETTSEPLDLAIEGSGFFKVAMPDGSFAYSRDGGLKENSQGQLVNASGFAIQPEITIPPTATNIAIGTDGTVSVTLPGQTPQTVGNITLTLFPNPAGLTNLGSNNFAQTAASGAPTDGTPGQQGYGQLAQGTLEMSNVQIVQEMVNMITAQRAYETNSKAIQTADSMLEIANGLTTPTS
jgi:flagellar basal-body rod protein FlgG